MLTFGMAHGTMDMLLPMAVGELRALEMEFLMLGVSAASIRNVLSAIGHRHRMAGLAPPLVERLAFQAHDEGGGVSGRHVVTVAFSYQSASLMEVGAVATTIAGKADSGGGGVHGNGVLQPGLGAGELAVVLFAVGARRSLHSRVAAALVIRIGKRKQDTGRYGLYVLILAGLLVDLICAHVAERGLRMDDRCTKGKKAGVRGPYFDPVFPRLRVG